MPIPLLRTLTTGALAVLAACGSDPAAPLDLDFTGDYTVTSMEFTSIDRPEIHDNLIRPGTIADMSIRDNDSLTIRVITVGQPTAFVPGLVVSVSPDSVTLEIGSETMTGTWSRSGKVLDFDLPSGFNIDLDQDGIAELCRVRLKLKEV